MRYHWMHYFYYDMLILQPGHPGFEYHVGENEYSPKRPNTEPGMPVDKYLELLLHELFSPITGEYTRILELADKHNGELPEAKTIVKSLPDSFLPYVEEVLSSLTEHGLLQKNSSANGFVPGPRWADLNSFFHSGLWDREKIPDVGVSI